VNSRGRRPVILSTVAERAGVSVSLVSRILTGDPTLRVRADTRERVLKTAAEFNYVPHGAARALRLSRASAVGLVVNDVSNPIHAEIIKGAQQAVSARGQVLLLADASELAESAGSFDRLVGEGRVDGLLWQGSGFGFDAELTARASQILPTLLVNSSSLAGVPAIRLQDEAAAGLAVDHLADLGHRRIGYVGGRPGSDLSARRLAGYQNAMRRHGLRTPAEWQVEEEWDAGAGYRAMTRLLQRSPRPTAVLVANVVVATGALAAVGEAGLAVPGDLSVATLHDAWFAEHGSPPLTTVRLPLRSMGQRAVDLVLSGELDEAAQGMVITDPAPDLVIRRSTAPPERLPTRDRHVRFLPTFPSEPGGPIRMTYLRGMTWNHPRGVWPLRAATEVFRAGRDLDVEWDARSLREFEETPVAVLAEAYDLLAIDHPFIGQAAASGALLPLEAHLPEELIADLRAASVGPSFASYLGDGHLWALPVDAAAQVSAYRPDLLPGPPPRTWEEALTLLADLPAGLSAQFPANPTHLWGSFLTLCHHLAGPASARGRADASPPAWWRPDGPDPALAAEVVHRLQALLRLVDPVSLEHDPIQTLTAMASGDSVAYAPIVFGYVSYARDGYAEHLVRFADVPSPGPVPAGSMLGGVGLAVSARCADPALAATFAGWLASADCQRGIYASSGGQPGHRSAWTDPAVNAAAHGFFEDTLGTLDAAFVRDRGVEYPVLQQRAGALLHQLISRGERPAAVVSELAGLWRSLPAQEMPR
jgi:DNA-binding LacI/PurR family transcriptional regulator/ABC-type glycerol-3-phosphate transport system substrate-binding protein